MNKLLLVHFQPRIRFCVMALLMNKLFEFNLIKFFYIIQICGALHKSSIQISNLPIDRVNQHLALQYLPKLLFKNNDEK